MRLTKAFLPKMLYESGADTGEGTELASLWTWCAAVGLKLTQ